jgi:hypothetical protein
MSGLAVVNHSFALHASHLLQSPLVNAPGSGIIHKSCRQVQIQRTLYFAFDIQIEHL